MSDYDRLSFALGRDAMERYALAFGVPRQHVWMWVREGVRRVA